MANNLDASTPEYWSKRMQIIREKETVFNALANMEERSALKDGDTIHRPYRSDMYAQTYTKGTAVSVKDVTSTDESLVVNTAKVVPFYVDDIDDLQNKYKTVNKFADDAGKDLFTFIDGDFLGEYINATSDIDDGDAGGTAGVSAILSTSNIAKFFAAANKKLNQQNVGMKNRFAVISPTVHQILVERLDGKDTGLGDDVGENGKVGRYMGFDIHVSNNLSFTATWTPADEPTANDTVTINGVIFKFVASPSAAGDIDLGGTVAATLDNLVGAINLSGTAGSDYVVVTDANRAKLSGCVATDGATKMTIKFESGGEVVVAASEAADPWTLETVHQLFGEKGAIDMVIQKQPVVVFKDVPDKLGVNVLPWTLYGLKTFTEGAKALVDGRVDSSVF